MKLGIYMILFTFFTFVYVNFTYANITVPNIIVSPIKKDISFNKGDIYSSYISIFNNGNETVELISNVVNMESNGVSGIPNIVYDSLDLKNPTQHVSEWVEVSTPSLKLLPGEDKTISYEISVPDDASVGGHYGIITFTTPENRNSVDFDVLYGTILLVNIEGEGLMREIEMKKVSVNSIQNLLEFGLLLENTGNTHITPNIKVTLKRENGDIIKQIGKDTIINEYGAIVGEEEVDYLPLNRYGGSILPGSTRIYSNELEWDLSFFDNEKITAVLDIEYVDENDLIIELTNTISFLNNSNVNINMQTKNELLRNINNTKTVLGESTNGIEIITKLDGLLDKIDDEKLLIVLDKLKNLEITKVQKVKYHNILTYLELNILTKLYY